MNAQPKLLAVLNNFSNEEVSMGTSFIYLKFKMRLVVIFLLFPFVVYCQKIKVSGYVIDTKGNPLQYVNVVSIGKKIGTVTDDHGFFTISADIKDSLKFSHIAFETRTISVNDIKSDTIILVEYSNVIKEVVVRNFNSYLDKTKIGFFNKDNNGEFLLAPGNQIAVFIKNPRKKDALIKSITFKVKKRGKCNSKLRLRLLDNYKNMMHPGQDLLSDNYIIDNFSLQKSNTIDISKSKVFLPSNGIFIVIEWISNEPDCQKNSFPSIGANLSTKENLVWFNYRDRQWNKPDKRPLPNGNYMTPNIFLTVLY